MTSHFEFQPLDGSYCVTTKQTGDISEAVVTAALLRAGKTVLAPFGDRSRYDIALDEDGKLVRIQVKTGWVSDGCLVFRTCSSTRQKGQRVETRYSGQIEYFAVYHREADKIYLVPVDAVVGERGFLRLEPPRPKGKKKNLRYAEQFIFRA
jgi:hypothetical protein